MIEIYLQLTKSPLKAEMNPNEDQIWENQFYPLNPKTVYRRSLLIQPQKHVKYPKIFPLKCLNSPKISGRNVVQALTFGSGRFNGQFWRLGDLVCNQETPGSQR